MTWRPTPGMLKAESVVQTMLTDAATRHFFITDPTLRHRWVQTVADALDGFRSGADEPEFPLEERDEIPHLGNGQDDPPTRTYLAPLPYKAEPTADDERRAMEVQAQSPAKRRSRGRPKLSAAEKKKRKAAKQANAVEAEAAT